MTVSTTSSQITTAANGSASYEFPFIGVSTTDIIVYYTPVGGVLSLISPTLYSVNLNTPVIGEVWGVGGTMSPNSPSSYTSGSFTIARSLPLTQEAEISNQGNQYPIVTEEALDILCMEIQQVSARGGAFRGVWATNIIYNYGDIVQDGVNGTDSNSYYLCANANTSGVWATDLANGYWVLIIQSTIPVASLPLAIANGGTGQITAGAALNALGGISLSGSNTFTGTNSFTSGSITVPTESGTDNSANAASTAFVADNFSPITSPNFLTSAKLNGSPLIDKVNVQTFVTSGTYTPTLGMVFCCVEVCGAGGGGAGGSSNSAGGGGGGGSYTYVIVSASTIGASQSVTIGGGGSGASAGAGGNGGQTSVGSIVSANGGGGAPALGGVTDIQLGGGGAGGNTTAGGYYTGLGGGGGCGIYLNIAGNLAGISGAGGSSRFGGGGNGVKGASSAAGVAGGYGGGGSGGIDGATAGNGGSGIVVITEYISS